MFTLDAESVNLLAAPGTPVLVRESGW